ncbi:hypothetical protein RLV_4552 [Rhizobium leguminosarum bv. viciae]|nr:hypothetical protein RLV_4552 [Rhizobium leguminosarum bv. viciae]
MRMPLRSDCEAAAGSRWRHGVADCVVGGRVTTTAGEKPAESARPAPASGRNSTVVNSCMCCPRSLAPTGRMQPPIKSGKNNRLKSEGKLKEPKEQSNHRLPICMRLIAAVPKR